MKKTVTRLALLLILTSLFIPVLGFAPIPLVTAAEQVFFEDNFEKYTVGDFPSSGGWELWYNGIGTEEQVIVDNFSSSPTKSLKLLGLDFWAGFAAKRFTSTSSLIGFGVSVRVEETNGEGRDNARVAFTTKLSNWVSCEYAPVTFQDSGVIASGGQVLQSYIAGTWYNVKLVMDRADNTYSVWVDDELKGENLTVTTTSGPITDFPSSEIEAFSISQCYNSVTAYFDDVKIFSSNESDPRLELVPKTGISTTTLVGSGFAPDSQISVTWDGIPIPTVPDQVITNSSGGFTCILSVLNQTDGAYNVRAVDETGNEAAATFTVALAPQSETTIIVPDDYPTIQDAINNAQEGDTIAVKAGTLEGHLWNCTIPTFPHGTTITYTITAEDKVENTVTTEEQNGQPNQYEVLPEFPLWIFVPLFLAATASAIAAKKRPSVPDFAKIYNSLHKLLT